jgi:hypothetical protein
MSTMIQKIPSMGDNELTILYQNCLREITNATPQVASAQLIVDAINDDWRIEHCRLPRWPSR